MYFGVGFETPSKMIKKAIIILLSIATIVYGHGSYKIRGDYENKTGNILLSADEKELVFYNLDDPYVSDVLDANTVSLRASELLGETYYMRWPIDSGPDSNNVLMGNGSLDDQLWWGQVDANLIDGNDIKLPEKTPWNVIFVDANGFPIYDDPNHFTYYQPSGYFGVGTDYITGQTYANNYIQVYTLLDFHPTLFNTTIGMGSDDVTTGPNNVRIGHGAGDALDEGYENTLGGKDAGTYLVDSNDNTGWGYKVIGGNGTGGIAAPFRDEATVISANAKVIWLASDYSVLAYEDLPGKAQVCNTVAVDPDGVVVAGYSTSVSAGPCIARWDTDLVIDDTFFEPTAGWGLVEWVGTVRFNHDGTYLYAATDKKIYKFDASTGAEVWQVSPNYQDGYNLYIDADDNMYVVILTGTEWPVFPGVVKIYDSDGTLTTTLTTGNLCRDIKVDETNDRIYICGSTNQIDAYTGGSFPYSYHSIAAIDTDGTDWNYYSIGDSKTIWGMVKIGHYIYATGDRTAFGFEGATASVYKFDTSLNIVDSYDTGYSATHIWVDWDDNIVVKSGSGATGGVWLLDTDLNYVADYRVTLSETYGNEGAIIPFMTEDVSPNVHRVAAFGAYAASTVYEGADDGLYLGTYSGAHNETDPNRFFLDNLDRGTYLGEKGHGMMYGYFAEDPNDQWLIINADVNMPQDVDVNSLTVDDLTINDLTASRLVSTNASKVLASTNLNLWVTGVADETDIADDGDGTITIGIVDPVIVGKGGTGAATFTDGGVLLGSGTSAFTPMAVLADGEFIVGDGTTDPVAESGNTARTSLGLGTGDSPTFVKTTLTGNEINIATAQTPASAAAAGTQGDIAWDSGYVYVCVADNTWKRSALTSWGLPQENVTYAGENVIYAAEQVVYP